MRRRLTHETWEQIKTAYAAGIGLRKIARKNEPPRGNRQLLIRVHDETLSIVAVCVGNEQALKGGKEMAGAQAL